MLQQFNLRSFLEKKKSREGCNFVALTITVIILVLTTSTTVNFVASLLLIRYLFPIKKKDFVKQKLPISKNIEFMKLASVKKKDLLEITGLQPQSGKK